MNEVCALCGHDHTCYCGVMPDNLGFCCSCDGDDEGPCGPQWEDEEEEEDEE